jgi:HEAT repeat protein
LHKILLVDGFLHHIQNGSILGFPLPEFQSAFAAEALLSDNNWLLFISKYINHPSWGELISSAAFHLGKHEKLQSLEQLFTILCDRIDNPPSPSNALLLCHCFSTLTEMTRNKLELLGIGDIVREKLFSFLVTTPVDSLYALEAILLLMRTDQMEYWMIGLLGNNNLTADKKRIIAKILGLMKSILSISALGDIALDANIDISLRGVATIALGKIQSPDSLPILQKIISVGDLFPYIVEALASHDSLQSAELLLSSANFLDHWDPSEFPFTNPEVITPLDRALKSRKLSLQKYLPAIAAITSPRSIFILERFLYFERTFTQSARLLSGLLDPKACDALIRFAENNNNPLSDRSNIFEILPKVRGLWDIKLLFIDTGLLSPSVISRHSFPGRGGIQILFGAKVALSNSEDSDLPDELNRMLAQVPADQRFVVIQIMIQQNRPVFIPIFKELIHDKDSEIRSLAFRGLSTLRAVPDPEAIIKRMQSALEEESKLFPAVPLLVRSILKNTDDDNFVAVEALGKIGGIEALAGLIEAKQQLLIDEDLTCCQENYAKALVRIGEPEGIKIVVDYTTMAEGASPGDSWRCSKYLEQVRNPSAIPYLCELLRHHLSSVRFCSLMALLAMRCEKAIPGLLEIIHNRDEGIWNYAFRSMKRNYGCVQEPSAITSFVEGLFQSDDYVREACLIGIGKVPRRIVPTAAKTAIRGIIVSEQSQHLFSIAVQTYSEVGGDATPYFLRLLASGFFQFPNPEDREFRLQIIRSALGQLVFLPYLVENLPQTKLQLNSLSQNYGFQVLPNKNILLPEGRELPAKQAVKWLLLHEKYRSSIEYFSTY